MIIKKRSLVLLLIALAILPFASAQYFGYGFGVEGFLDSMVQNISPILNALFGGYDWTGYLLFEKLLLFLLVAIVVYIALSNVPVFKDRDKKLLKFISIIVALIGIRNLDYIWLNTIFTQYKVIFIAVAGILPFIIYWFFLDSLGSSGLRKVGWIFFAVIYFGLWATTEVDAHEEIYLWSAIGSLIYAIFFDAMVHNWLEIQGMKKGNKQQLASIIATHSKEIEIIQENIVRGHYRTPGNVALAEERIKLLEARIRKLQKGF